MNNKKYFWLKLNKDFFKQHEIRIIEETENGKDYILFYLKLLVESISHEGSLRFNDTIPYNDKMLSTITNTNIDIVRSAIKIFSELKLMEILDNGTIYMTETSKMIGSETKWAKYKRIEREDDELDIVQNLSNRERDKSLDISSSSLNIYEFLEKNFGRPLAPIELEKIEEWKTNFNIEEDMIEYATRIATYNDKKTFGYIEGILRNWFDSGYRTLDQVKEHENKKTKESNTTIEIPEYDWLNENVKNC